MGFCTQPWRFVSGVAEANSDLEGVTRSRALLAVGFHVKRDVRGRGGRVFLENYSSPGP